MPDTHQSIELLGTDDTAITVSWARGIVCVSPDAYLGTVVLRDREDLDRLVGALVSARLEAFTDAEDIDWDDYDVDGVDPWGDSEPRASRW